MHSDEFNRILKSSKYYSSNSFVKCQSSPTIIEEGMPASVCDHTIALGNLLRGEYLERSGVFRITFDHDTFNIIGAVSLITVVAIARYVLNRLMYVPYKAQLQKRGGDSGVNLIVAITKEMRQVNMESNIVSPSPQEHIVSRTPDDEFAVLDNMNEISDHTISSRDSMNDIVTRSNSSDGNTVASSINSSCYSDRGGLRCRTPLSSGEVAVIHERRKS